MEDQRARLSLDAASGTQVGKIQQKITAFTKRLANEPSSGCFEIQEHSHRVIPRVGEASRRLAKSSQSVSDSTYDIDFSVLTVKSWQEIESLQRVKRFMSASIMILESMSNNRPLPSFSLLQDPVAKKPATPQRKQKRRRKKRAPVSASALDDSPQKPRQPQAEMPLTLSASETASAIDVKSQPTLEQNSVTPPSPVHSSSESSPGETSTSSSDSSNPSSSDSSFSDSSSSQSPPGETSTSSSDSSNPSSSETSPSDSSSTRSHIDVETSPTSADCPSEIEPRLDISTTIVDEPIVETQD